MTLSLRPSRASSSALAGIGLLALAVLIGCASPGVPRPPSLHLPASVTDLSATRIGDRVELRWTAPTRTTDGLDLEGPTPAPTTVEICRDPSTQITSCTPVLRLIGHPGSLSAVDTLPPSLTAPPLRGTAVAYRIRVLNAAGRSAPPSAPLLIPAGPPLDPVQDFHATQTRDGVVLQWSAQGGPAAGTVEVLRTLVDPAPVAKPPPKGRLPGPRTNLDPAVHLEPTQAGAHGMLDAGALRDTAYLYQAQRLLPVIVAGATVVLKSEPTPPIQLAMHDRFPPRPPSGLAAIPGAAGTTSTIDLSWQPNSESDLAGYVVYRTDLDPANPFPPHRLTPTPLPGPAFSDPTVVPGRRYEYRVTALDLQGNESPPSPPVAEKAVKPF